MKKFLLLLLIVVTFGCQKDFYLDELNAAEAEIAQLNSISEAQQSEIRNLKEIIETVNRDIENAQNHIVVLDSLLVEANQEIKLLDIDIERLVGLVEDRQVALDSLTAQAEVDAQAITDLTEEVASLEAALAQAETLAQNQANRITELENVEPTIITVVRTNTVYRDRDVPVYITRGVTYSEGGSNASNLDVTDCAGAAIARVVSGNLTFSIAPSNASGCEGDLGIEVIKEGQTDPILSNASHFAVIASTSSFTMGEVVTIRATGVSSFTATVTIPTLPASGQGSETMENQQADPPADPCASTTATGAVINGLYWVTLTPGNGCSIDRIRIGNNTQITPGVNGVISQAVNYVSGGEVIVRGYTSSNVTTPTWTTTLTMPLTQVSSPSDNMQAQTPGTGTNSVTYTITNTAGGSQGFSLTGSSTINTTNGTTFDYQVKLNANNWNGNYDHDNDADTPNVSFYQIIGASNGHDDESNNESMWNITSSPSVAVDIDNVHLEGAIVTLNLKITADLNHTGTQNLALTFDHQFQLTNLD